LKSSIYYRARRERALLLGWIGLLLFIVLIFHTAALILSANRWAWATGFPAPAALMAALLEFRESARCRHIHNTRFSNHPTYGNTHQKAETDP